MHVYAQDKTSFETTVEMWNTESVGYFKRKCCKNSPTGSYICLSVRKYELNSRARFGVLMALFLRGFKSSGMWRCTLGLVVHLWMTVFKGWVVQEDVLTHEDEGITIFRNVGTRSPSDTAPHLRRLESPTRQRLKGFDVLLTVRLSIILVTDQLNAQILVL